MEDTDLAYWAGIIDGEGSIGFMGSKPPYEVYTPIIQITNTNPQLSERLKVVWGGKVATFQPKGNSKLAFRWRLAGKGVIEMIRAIFPYLNLKLPQAEEMLHFGDIHEAYGVKKLVKASEGYLIEARKSASILHTLNHRGTLDQ